MDGYQFTRPPWKLSLETHFLPTCNHFELRSYATSIKSWISQRLNPISSHVPRKVRFPTPMSPKIMLHPTPKPKPPLRLYPYARPKNKNKSKDTQILLVLEEFQSRPFWEPGAVQHGA